MENIFIKNRKFAIYFLVFLSFFLALFRFTSTPKVWVDEGVFTNIARNLEDNGVIGIQTSPGNVSEVKGWVLSSSYPVLFPVALSFKLFGVGIWQARLPMVIYVLLFLFASYLFVRKRYGDYPAFLSTLLLLSFAPLYGNGRPVQGEVPGLFFLVLGSYFLLILEEKNYNSTKFSLLSGLAFGLSCATKAIYLTFISVSLIIALVIWYKKINNKTILYFSLGFCIPILLWFFMHFPTIKLMSGMVGSYLYFAGNHSSDLSKSIIIWNNFKRFFTESTPILFSFISFFVLSSIYIRFYKQKDNVVTISEFIIFSFIFLNWAGYLNGTGWYRYFFPANTLLYIVFIGSVLSLVKFFKNRILINLLAIIPIALVVFQFYYLVFLSDVSFVVNRTRNSELASVLGNISVNKSVLFYNSIETIVFLKSDNYFQYLQMDDFLVVGDEKSLSKPGPDFILTDKSQRGNVALSCYTERPLSQYYFLEKTTKCKI
ncbi:MAG: hypothetical protein AB201_03390 [Parcubacteria bacterium C7867-006]|nr:MAG: hypothetical protein AB201_03390 [Parcubacteria bacterium C7867-006]